MKQKKLFLQTDSAVVLPKWSQKYFQAIIERMRENSLSKAGKFAISTMTKPRRQLQWASFEIQLDMKIYVNLNRFSKGGD